MRACMHICALTRGSGRARTRGHHPNESDVHARPSASARRALRSCVAQACLRYSVAGRQPAHCLHCSVDRAITDAPARWQRPPFGARRIFMHTNVAHDITMAARRAAARAAEITESVHARTRHLSEKTQMRICRSACRESGFASPRTPQMLFGIVVTPPYVLIRASATGTFFNLKSCGHNPISDNRSNL